ncbi:MAG: succinoglycan biosynthesis protein ExoO [Solirubrobacteraceae bacterium]|nr:succinoglycan biosynthesis protein ExoO [Solirubrobacteraceae bacterium]
MKLSLLLPTHNSAATIERTLSAALAQRHRPLEVVVYDEASADDTRAIVRRLLDAAPDGVDARLRTAEENSGPVLAWRVALHDATGDWCTFVWADDVLRHDFSERMMEAADRARTAGRKLVTGSGEVEMDGEVRQAYASDTGLLTPQAFSAGMFFRRYPLTQICATYETAAAREVFDRHVRFDNPLGFDYNRHPYGNDVGYLSELAAAGGGTERIGEPLVRLTDSETSMTRLATGSHLWQMRWQYTFNQARVWRTWEEQGVPGAGRLRAMGVRRLALCTIMLQRDARDLAPRRVARAVGAYLDFLRFDFQKTRMTLDDFRRRLNANGIPA